MSRHRDFHRGPSSYKRGPSRIPPSGHAFLIVTEGQKTEPNYLAALRDRLKLTLADVEVVQARGTDPMSLVHRAIELRDQRQKLAKNDTFNYVKYDEVWVVFDVEAENHPRRKQAPGAIQLCQREGVRVALSNPCFEFWLLLHEVYTTAPCADYNAVKKRLRVHHPTYDKGWNPTDEFLKKLPIAVKNSERCRQHHRSAQGSGNPSTHVDLLCRNLNGATRNHLQFNLA